MGERELAALATSHQAWPPRPPSPSPPPHRADIPLHDSATIAAASSPDCGARAPAPGGDYEGPEEVVEWEAGPAPWAEAAFEAAVPGLAVHVHAAGGGGDGGVGFDRAAWEAAMAREMPDQGTVDRWIDELDDDEAPDGAAPAGEAPPVPLPCGAGAVPSGANCSSETAPEEGGRSRQEGQGTEPFRALWDPGVRGGGRAPHKRPRVVL